MATFNGNNGAFTPTTSNPAAGGAANGNWMVDASGATGAIGKIISYGWGGRLTTSTGYRTRWGRFSTAPAGAKTNFSNQPQVGGNPNQGTNALTLTQFFATTNPSMAADPASLDAQDWNAQGGLGKIILPLANPWWVISGVLNSGVWCLNVAGVDASGSSYGVTWEE